MNAAQVLEWIKANVFIVIFAVLMIAAVVALPLVSSRLNESVKDTVSKRAKMISDVKSLEKTPVEPPQAGKPVESQNTIVNEALLEQYKQLASEMKGDADAVVQKALAFNRKDHDVLMANIFPEMPPTQVEVLPKRFHEVVVAAYGALEAEIGSGMPPNRRELADELRREQLNFISQAVQKDRLEDLTDEEKAELKKKLTEIRLAKNREQAEKISLYLSPSLLPVPVWDQSRLPSVAYMFNWNWEYWVVQDVLRALHQANETDGTVLLAPVKRVTKLQVTGLPAVSTTAPTAAPAGIPGASGQRGRSGTSGGGSKDAGGGAAQPTPPDPSRQVTPDYSLRFTGRTTNALYDVITVNLGLIVDSTRIPEVLDAIAQENFFTVVDLNMQPIDPFKAAAGGYMYGNAPVCDLELTIDTVWLRQWTKENMPEETRTVLGIPVEKPAASDT